MPAPNPNVGVPVAQNSMTVVPAQPPVTMPAFAPNVPVSVPRGGKTIWNILGIAKAAWDSMPVEKKTELRNKLKNKAVTVADRARKGKGRSNRSGNSSGNNNNGGGDGNMGTNVARGASGIGLLSRAASPEPISLNSGVMPNTFTSDYMESSNLKCAPLHVTAAKVYFPTSTSNTMLNYFNNIIAFHLQVNAQRNVAFNINITSDMTAANILSAMNSLAYALQIYFYYRGIESYCQTPGNKNGGMHYMYRQFTPQMYEDMMILERRLLDTPVPPNLLKLIRYMSGNFLSGMTAGSPLLKIIPVNATSTCVDLTAPSAAFTALITDNNNKVFTLLRRAVPHWVPATLSDIPTSPFYDDNFKTIWANCPFYSYFNSTSNYIPNASSSSTAVMYNSFTNHLDGVAFALTSIYDTTLTTQIPGMLIPVTAAGASNVSNTRWSYYETSGGSKAFFPSDGDGFLLRSRPETFKLADAGTSYYAIHLPGAQMCESVNQLTIRETALNALDWIMSFDNIKVDARNFHFGTKSYDRKGGK